MFQDAQPTLWIPNWLSSHTDWDYAYWLGSPSSLTETMEIELALHPHWLRLWILNWLSILNDQGKKTLSVLNSGIFHIYLWAHLSFHPVSDHIITLHEMFRRVRTPGWYWPHHLSSAKWCTRTWDKQHVTNTTVCVNPGSLLCRQTPFWPAWWPRPHLQWDEVLTTMHTTRVTAQSHNSGRWPAPTLAYPALTAQECSERVLFAHWNRTKCITNPRFYRLIQEWSTQGK